jgi:Ca2+/Na+ antiporter
MKHYIKRAMFPLVYIVVCLILDLSVLALDAKLIWLRYIFLFAVLCLFALVVYPIARKDGENDYNKLINNDRIRQHIVETGDDIYFDRREEFKPYKGFLVGVIACAPLILLLILHTITIIVTDGENIVFGQIGSTMYSIVSMFFSLIYKTPTAYTCYYSLLAVPIISCVVGIPYLIGAKRVKLGLLEIQRKSDIINGKR